MGSDPGIHESNNMGSDPSMGSDPGIHENNNMGSDSDIHENNNMGSDFRPGFS